VFSDHLDLTMPLVWTADDALTPEQCDDYIARFRAGSAEVAPVIGRHGVAVDLAVRSNTRVMWDDPDEADRIVSVLGSTVPQKWKHERLVGGNPRLRIYQYAVGEHHGTHWDTVVELPHGIASRITLVLYLNDSFDGGDTEFPELGRRVTPRRGRALLFQHRVLHTALAVTRGTKYVLRTDILYQPSRAT
jgi:prolyl 4-hydroxylase